MKKRVVKLILIPVAIIILLAIVLTFTIDQIIQSTIESTGSEILQTRLSVDNVSISLFNGTGTIEGLTIANPEDFESGEAITITSIEMKIDLSTILSNTVVVDQIKIQQLDVNYYLKPTGSNLGELLNNLENYSADATDETESSMIIELFVMEESSVTVDTQFEELQTIRVNLPYVEQEGIGRGENQNITEVIQTILKIMISRVADVAFEAVKNEGADKLLDKAGDAIKNLFNN